MNAAVTLREHGGALAVIGAVNALLADADPCAFSFQFILRDQNASSAGFRCPGCLWMYVHVVRPRCVLTWSGSVITAQIGNIPEYLGPFLGCNIM